MRAAIINDNNQIAGDLFGLMKIKKINLTKICNKYDLDYQKYYRAMHAPIIELDFLDTFCKLIDPKIKIEYSINSVSLKMDIIYIPS